MASDGNFHSGGCKCRAIRYRTARHSGRAFICNCRSCQKMTGGPFLVEHCFAKDEIEILSGTPRIYTHLSAGSGKEVGLHFCAQCGSHLFRTFERWNKKMNVVTTTLDRPQDLHFDADTLSYLFLASAQSGTITPKGFRAYEGFLEPADSPPHEHVFDHHVLNTETDASSGPHTGACLCSSVRYEADGQPDALVICHCRSCQQSLGSGVNFELLWRPERFRHIAGTPGAYRHPGGSGKSIEKRFCKDCGSALWLTGERFAEVGVFRGTLDRPNRIEIDPSRAVQIYLSEALPSAMVIAGIETFSEHRRAPDNSINEGQTYDHHWRLGDGPIT